MESKYEVTPEFLLTFLQHTGILMGIGLIAFVFVVTTFVQVFLNNELNTAGKIGWAIGIALSGLFLFGVVSFVYAFIYYKHWAKLVPAIILLAGILSFGWFMKDLFTEVLESDQFQQQLEERQRDTY